MNKFSKWMVGAALTLGAACASANISVQGITWNPDSTDPVDFQAAASLTQWYQTLSNGAAFNPTGAVASFSTPASLLNTYVTGAGKFATINGVNNISGDPLPETDPATFGTGRELTYAFGGILINSVSVSGTNVTFGFDLSQSYIRVYSDTPADYAESSISLAEQLDAADTDFLVPFLTGKFDFFGGTFNLLTGGPAAGTLAGFAEGLVSVTGGAALDNFDTNTKVLGDIVSDISFTGSTQSAVGSVKSTVGTAEIQGNSVPEPGTLALVGLSLMAAGYARRKTK